ncbi:MAG: hypothetical protein ACI9MC_001384, partial [Kiritimatiellia bacterium]
MIHGPPAPRSRPPWCNSTTTPRTPRLDWSRSWCDGPAPIRRCERCELDFGCAPFDKIATTWLRRLHDRGEPGTTDLLEELDQPLLEIETPDDARPGQTPMVSVRTRNIEQIEVSLHHIDVEAYLESGGKVADLAQLDVDVIRPDRRTTHTVPPGAQSVARTWQLPIDVPRPGLYAITVATRTRKARALLLISNTHVVTHRVGERIHVAVFDGARPVPGARVVVDSGEMLRSVTDRRGYAIIEGAEAAASLTVVTTQGPAFVDLPSFSQAREVPEPTIQVDLDRPAYRPGDSVGFRLVAPADHAAGDWRVWLTGPGHTEQVLRASANGTVSGEIIVPVHATGSRDWAANVTSVKLMVVPPWTHQPQSVASVSIADEVPQQRRLDVQMVDSDAVVSVIEPDGRPAIEVPIEWRWSGVTDPEYGVTDKAGRVHISGPPIGIPWSLQVTIRGVPGVASATRPVQGGHHMKIGVDQDRFSLDEPAMVNIEGEGTAVLRVSEVLPLPAPVDSVREPWPTALRVGMTLNTPPTRSTTPSGLRRTVRELSLQVSGASVVDVGALAPGEYQVEVWDGGAMVHGGHAEFTVGGGPRLAALSSVGPGQAVQLNAERQPALVMVRAGEQVQAMVIEPGQGVQVPVRSDWSDRVQVDAIFADGSTHSRSAAVDNTPEVSIEAIADGPDWLITAQVLDRDGRALRAEVTLSVVDPELESWAGATPFTDSGPLHTAPLWSMASAYGLGLADGALSTAVAEAFLQEEQQLAERRKARVARTGRLSENLLHDMMGVQVPLQVGMGGMGSMGSGAGGGGSFGARGRDGIGRMGGGVGSLGRHVGVARPQPGERSRVLWRVVQTDAEGRVQVRIPRPQRRASWRLRAVAVGAGVVGRAETTLRTDDRPALLVPRLTAAVAGTSARPVALVVNGSDAPLNAVVRIGDRDVPVQIAAGEHAEIPMGDVHPSDVIEVSLHTDESDEMRVLHWPLDIWHSGVVPTVTHVPTGLRGAPPYLWFATQVDPLEAHDPGRAARSARSLMSTLPHLHGPQRRAALRRLESLLVGLDADFAAYDSVTSAAHALAAMAEGRKYLNYSTASEIALSKSIQPNDATRDERVTLLWARVAAGIDVSDATVARSLRERQDLDAEHRSQLARTLIVLERSDEAQGLISGEGPQAQLARRALGRRASVPLVDPPSPDDPTLADWIAA